MKKQRVLTGIKPTGTPHLGNYIGAIKPALNFANDGSNEYLYFIADYHALTTVRDKAEFMNQTYEVAATWLAFGLNIDNVSFYKQSDIPEIFELNWLLSCVTPKGLINRAHAYKAAVSKNIEAGLQDQDVGINMGVYNYPVLMAADILLFDTDIVPVGMDQVQHVEIARDIAISFNKFYGKVLMPPKHFLKEGSASIKGLDGRKMSKSYNNTIPLFLEPNALRKLIFKIQTNSSAPTEPKDPEACTLFSIYKEFAAPNQTEEMKVRYQNGISWKEVKEELFELIDSSFSKPRAAYREFMDDRKIIDERLKEGALKVRGIAQETLERVRKAIGKF